MPQFSLTQEEADIVLMGLDSLIYSATSKTDVEALKYVKAKITRNMVR